MKSTVCLPFQCDSSCFEVLPEDCTFEESSKRQTRVLSVQCEGESMLTLSYVYVRNPKTIATPVRIYK